MSASAIRPQSLIFTLFGDYIHPRADRIRIGSLIQLLALFGVSEQSVRTTVSRMAQRGWLGIERGGGTSFYVLTPAAQKLIEEGAARIFQPPAPRERWDGCWHLVTFSIPESQRDARDRFRRELSWLGYGLLTNAVWISPHDPHARIEALVESLDIKPYVHSFHGSIEGFAPVAQLVARCWNLSELNADYGAFIEKYESSYHDCRQRLTAHAVMEEGECFARRFMLIHEYRRFPYRDPYLPSELLPRDWRGLAAAALFHDYHRLLEAPANNYFESCISNFPRLSRFAERGERAYS